MKCTAVAKVQRDLRLEEGGGTELFGDGQWSMCSLFTAWHACIYTCTQYLCTVCHALAFTAGAGFSFGFTSQENMLTGTGDTGGDTRGAVMWQSERVRRGPAVTPNPDIIWNYGFAL